MQLRKNTKAFKTIVEIVTACQQRPDRETLIRLYITKAGHSIQDRISVEGIQGGDAALFYDMSYDTVLSNLQSSTHQLHASDEVPGIYFFHSTSNKTWDETPFEFDNAISKEFNSLAELPVTRKKGKTEKTVLSVPKVNPTSPTPKRHQPAKAAVTTKPEAIDSAARRNKSSKGPDFKLKHDIEFTNLEKVIFPGSKLNKWGILEYYHAIAEYLLPYLKDRLLSTRRDAESMRSPVAMKTEELFHQQDERVPRWIKQQILIEGKEKKAILLCNDKEHLLFYVEMGCLSFGHSLSRIKTIDLPDYLVLSIDSPEFELSKAVEVALAAKEIFDGLHLDTGIKTDGHSGLQVYLPLDGKSTYDTTRVAGEYLCKLIKIKSPERVSIAGTDDAAYGKVSLDYSSNVPGQTLTAPYSLVAGQSAIVSTPLLWKEVKEGLRAEDFNHETIFKKLKQAGDPFRSMGKKINADVLLKRLEEDYSFLF